MNTPKFTYDKIKFATDEPTLKKAIDLYSNNKVTDVKEEYGHYTAKVVGSEIYAVSLDGDRFGFANCNCYIGKNSENLCKHMVALAIYAVKDGKPLSDEEKNSSRALKCSGKVGDLSDEELASTKKSLSDAMRYIKPYTGPSRRWFAYQDSLSEGCYRMASIIADLPVSIDTSKILVNLLIKIDNKLCIGGVDDSDGTVGDFVRNIVVILVEFAKIKPECKVTFSKLKNRETCFGWEEPLLELTRKD